MSLRAGLSLGGEAAWAMAGSPFVCFFAFFAASSPSISQTTIPKARLPNQAA